MIILTYCEQHSFLNPLTLSLSISLESEWITFSIALTLSESVSILFINFSVTIMGNICKFMASNSLTKEPKKIVDHWAIWKIFLNVKLPLFRQLLQTFGQLFTPTCGHTDLLTRSTPWIRYAQQMLNTKFTIVTN